MLKLVSFMLTKLVRMSLPKKLRKPRFWLVWDAPEPPPTGFILASIFFIGDLFVTLAVVDSDMADEYLLVLVDWLFDLLPLVDDDGCSLVSFGGAVLVLLHCSALIRVSELFVWLMLKLGLGVVSVEEE